MTSFSAQTPDEPTPVAQENTERSEESHRIALENRLMEYVFPQLLRGEHALRLATENSASPLSGDAFGDEPRVATKDASADAPHVRFDQEAISAISQTMAEIAAIDPREAACAIRLAHFLSPFSTLPFFMACSAARTASDSDVARSLVHDMCERESDAALMRHCWKLMEEDDRCDMYSLPDSMQNELLDARQTADPSPNTGRSLTAESITQRDEPSAWECLVALERPINPDCGAEQARQLLDFKNVRAARIRPRTLLSAWLNLAGDTGLLRADDSAAIPGSCECDRDSNLLDALESALSATARKGRLKGHTLVLLPPCMNADDAENLRFAPSARTTASAIARPLSAMEHIALTCAVLGNSSGSICIAKADGAGRYASIDYAPSGNVLQDTFVILHLMEQEKSQDIPGRWSLESTLDTAGEFDLTYRGGMAQPTRILASRKACDALPDPLPTHLYWWDDEDGLLLPFDYPVEYMRAAEACYGRSGAMRKGLRKGDMRQVFDQMLNR